MKDPVLKEDSAPSLVEYLDNEDIEYVIFDLDGTLLKTDEHFHDLLTRLGLEISTCMEDISPNYFLCDEIARQLENQKSEIYYSNNRQPTLIDELYPQALTKYFEYLGVGEITEQMQEVIRDYAHECYSKSPKEYDFVVEILREIISSGRGVLFHSHAQDSWTKIKAEYLSKLSGLENIDYLATPMERKKDIVSWLEAIVMTKSKPERILTVGDNFQADILPSIQAGCKNVVWINRLGRKLPKDFQLPEDANLYIVEDISELKFLNTNHRVLN
jgi:FMN phosphatase YigB (HAD superfamily)